MCYETFESLCKKHNVNPSKVSKETGVATSTLTSWKKGVYTPKREKLKLIANYFNVSVDYLMGSENYNMEPFTHTWEYSIPAKDMQLLIDVMSDSRSADRLIAYAEKLMEINEMENLK